MNAFMQSDGGVCRTSFRRMGGASALYSVNIVTQARYGTASAAGRGVTYRPRPGFKGDDQFVFAAVGAANGSVQRGTVRVTVTVR